MKERELLKKINIFTDMLRCKDHPQELAFHYTELVT